MQKEIVYQYTESDLEELELERQTLDSKSKCLMLSSLWVFLLLYYGDKLIQLLSVSSNLITFENILLLFIVTTSILAEIKYARCICKQFNLDYLEECILEELYSSENID